MIIIEQGANVIYVMVIMCFIILLEEANTMATRSCNGDVVYGSYGCLAFVFSKQTYNMVIFSV